MSDPTREALLATRRAWDEAWVGLDRIARSRMTMPAQGDGFVEGYEAGLREARGVALEAMGEAYRAFGEDPDSLPNGMVRLGGANVKVALSIADALAAISTTPAPLDKKRLARALQANQDHTYLDSDNHRFHCGGTCAEAIAREYAKP